MKVAEHSSRQFLATLIGKCHTVIKGVSRMMSSQMDHLASVLNPTEIEDLKAHAQEITTMKDQDGPKGQV